MGKKYDNLGDRMKTKYEAVTRTHLVSRMPVIIRLDGKAFHTFTRGFQKPFDILFLNSMQETMKYLCENIQGCVLGYTQSDEITLVLIDYKNLNSCAWFDNNIQKMCSIAASMATFAFNRAFVESTKDFRRRVNNCFTCSDAEDKLCRAYERSIENGATFDARVFNVPKEEVCNCILWRQNDATRNSIEMLGQAYFSHNQLHKKNTSQIQDMLMLEHGINWNDLPVHLKRGSCCIKVQQEGEKRSKWIIDTEIPIFKGEGRKYIDDLIFI